jgi:PAS domain-containing protein
VAEPASPAAPDARDWPRSPQSAQAVDWPAEVTRLNKIIRALMDRAERSTSVQASDFSLFQTAIMLEEQVRQRTAELEAALRENERTNRSLRESEAKFRAVVNQSLVGIVIIDDQEFSYTNARFNEIFGYGEDEIRALRPLDLVIDSDRPLVTEHFRRRLRGCENIPPSPPASVARPV